MILENIYKDDNKFSETGDNFALKVNIYYDKCRRVGLLPAAYFQGILIILSWQIQIYYYGNWGDTSFDNFCIKMCLFFESSKWQCLNLTRWQTINLNDTISSNSILITAECLLKLCTKLETIQQDLDPIYYGPVHLQKNIIRAYKGYLALVNGFTNLFLDILNLINNLYISIVNYEAVHKLSVQQSYIQYNDHDNDDYKSWFTDCKYQKTDTVFVCINFMAEYCLIYWHTSHFKHHLNNSKNVLYVISLAAGLPITFNKNAITLKHDLLASIPITKNNQGMIRS